MAMVRAPSETAPLKGGADDPDTLSLAPAQSTSPAYKVLAVVYFMCASATGPDLVLPG